jgi:hypothetical protein
MSGFPILDLILGLTFIYFVLSIICSAIVESILTTRHLRAKVLTHWLMTIFDKEMMQPDGTVLKLGQALANHCLTTALSGSGRAASFIDAKNFTTALIEKLSFNPEQPNALPPANLEELLRRIEEVKALDGSPMLSTELMRTFQIYGAEARLLAPESLVQTPPPAGVTQLPANVPPPNAKNALQIFREKLEAWYDSNMDRLSGSLKKRYVRPLTFWVGLVVVVMLNADTLQIASYLYDHKEETARFADRAQMTAQRINSDSASAVEIHALVDSMRATVPQGMPLGWTDAQQADWVGTMRHAAIGWLATVMAVMLGAPFWFDLLNKIANIRGSGSKPASVTDAERSLTGTGGK